MLKIFLLFSNPFLGLLCKYMRTCNTGVNFQMRCEENSGLSFREERETGRERGAERPLMIFKHNIEL